MILAGLVGAITWNLITWFFGLPSSSSHALIGGVIGSSIAASGSDVVKWDGLWEKVILPASLPRWPGHPRLRDHPRHHLDDRPPLAVEGEPGLPARPARLGGFVAFTHGTNDAQKTMGIIALALVSSGEL